MILGLDISTSCIGYSLFSEEGKLIELNCVKFNSDLTKFEKLEEFRKYLTEKMKDMLDKNYNLLINTLYRIDISEKKLAELFSSKNKESIPQKLADLIIERQIEKINFRKRYREGNL